MIADGEVNAHLGNPGFGGPGRTTRFPAVARGLTACDAESYRVPLPVR